ncbi:MAG: site-specific integrase [Burkholderiaceae bacterium]
MAAIRLHPTTKKPSVYWYEPNGKKRQKTFATRTDATKFKKIIEAELLTNKYISPFAGQTLIQEWLEVIGYSKQSNREITKIHHEQMYNKLILPFFGHKRLDAVKPTDVVDYLFHLQILNYSSETQRKALNLLSRIFATAIEEDMIYKNPCKTSIVRSSISAPEYKEQRYLTRDKLNWLADSIDPHFRELILFAGLTGVRKGELFGLDSADINGDSVTVSKSLSLVRGESILTKPKTAKSVRNVFIPEELQEYFASKTEGPIFTSLRGNRIQANNFRNRYFLPAVKASIGEPFRFHDLRHTAVALAIKENKHPFEISKMLGHTSIKTTFDVYGHLI